MLEVVASNPSLRPEVPNYDVSFDQKDYARLFSKRLDMDPDKFASELRMRDKYTIQQLITDAGERVNVNVSSTIYDAKNGQLWGRGMHEPFIDVIKRGRDKRREIGEKLHVYADFEREDAEVEGFAKAEEEVLKGKMAVIISPPGHAYLHSFYDIGFQNEAGEVEFRRYTSGVHISEYAAKAKMLDPNSNFTSNSKDSDYLASPLIVDSSLFRTPEDVHAFLHTNHSFMTEGNFNQIKNDQGFQMAINIYIEGMHKNPFATIERKKEYKGILNRVDFLRKIINGEDIDNFASDISDIKNWGSREPEKIPGGCGISGAESPWSVAEAGLMDAKGKLEFECPKCHQANFRPYGGYVAACQSCGSKEVACAPEKQDNQKQEVRREKAA